MTTCKHLRLTHIPTRELKFPFRKSMLLWCHHCGAIRKQGSGIWIMPIREATRLEPDPYIDVTNMPPKGQLKDIQVTEVSLVAKGPQGKKFSFMSHDLSRAMREVCSCRLCEESGREG